MDNNAICAVMVQALFLSACGGGGGSASNNAANSAANSLRIPETAAAIQLSYEPVDVALVWTPPTQRADGSPLPIGEISGYQICYVGSSGQINLVDVPGNLRTDFVLTDLEPDIYQFNVFTYDVDNNVSRPSSTVALSIDTFPEL